MVLCCLFWCQSFGDVSPYVCSYLGSDCFSSWPLHTFYFSGCTFLNGTIGRTPNGAYTIGANCIIGGNVGTNCTIGRSSGTIGRFSGVNGNVLINTSYLLLYS